MYGDFLYSVYLCGLLLYTVNMDKVISNQRKLFQEAKIKSLKTANKIAALACRGCLATHGKLYSILDVSLLEPYEDLIGYPVGSSDVYPKYLCMYCRSLLLNFLAFRIKCRTVLDVLKEAQDAGYSLTTGYVRSIDRNYYKLCPNYIQTKPDILECGHNQNDTNTVVFLNNVSDLQDMHSIKSINNENKCASIEFNNSNEMDNTIKHLGGKGITEIENYDKISQDDKENSNQNEEWLNEYLDIDSDSNMEVSDSNHNKKSTSNNKSDSDDFKNNRNDSNINKKDSTFEVNAVRRAKSPSLTSKSDKNVCNVDKKGSCTKNDSETDKNVSDSDNDMNESDSDIEDLINLFLKPTNYVKIVTNIGNRNNKNFTTQRNIAKKGCAVPERKGNTKGPILDMLLQSKGKLPKYDKVRKKKTNIIRLDQRNYRLKVRADKLGFNVQFFTKYEKLYEVERRRKEVIKPPNTTKCEMCGEDFETDACKEIHQEKFHNPDAPNYCQICQYRFESKLDLAVHLRIHNYEFTCRSCKFITRNKNIIADHYRKMHKTEEVATHVCAYCGKVFRKATWYMHMKTKHPTELLSCDLCSESLFFNNLDLKKHYDYAHKDVEQVNCDCNNTFLSRKALSKHQASGRCDLYPCKCCGVNLATEEQRQYHLFKHRMQCDMSEDYYNECGGCKVLFQSAEALETHVEECLEGGFPCVLCGENYNRNDGLNKHILDEHASEEATFNVKNIKAPEIMCEICGKCFKTPAALKQHQLAHAGRPRVKRYLRSHACVICSKVFVTNTRLRLHMRVHTEERPHRCAHCPKTFKWKTGLDKHKKWHHIENELICPVCGKTFRKKSFLEIHVQKHMNKQRHPKTQLKKEKRVNEAVVVQYNNVDHEDCEYLVLADDSSEYEDKLAV